MNKKNFYHADFTCRGSSVQKSGRFCEHCETLDKAAKEVGVNFIGGYSALVSKAMTKSDEYLIRSIPQALAQTERVCSSVNVGSTKTGINMDAVRFRVGDCKEDGGGDKRA